MSVGVLALQGDFAEHINVLRRLGVEHREVRLPQDLDGLDGLIIPGGESTTIARLMDLYGLRGPLKELVGRGTPVWGTCAGLILLAKRIMPNRPEPLGMMDVEVARNAFGRQVDSFEAELPVPVLGGEPFHAIFIRAPLITGTGEVVETLARLPDGKVVAARQRNMLGTAFHPELGSDDRFHNYFLTVVRESAGQ